MSHRNKREMAPPPHQTGAPSPNQSGSTPPPLSGTLNSNDLKLPPQGGQPAWWPVSLSQGNSSGVTSPNYAMDCYPHGGFMSYFQSGQQPLIPPHVQLPPPWPNVSNEIQSAPPSNDLGIQDAKARRKGKPITNIDDGNDVRTAKRLVFELDEDLNLVSA